MVDLEDKIFEYSKTLSEVENYMEDYTLQLDIDEEYYIKSSHVLNEDDEWVYNIVIYNVKDEAIDSVYCDENQENIEDKIIFLIEEYVNL